MQPFFLLTAFGQGSFVTPVVPLSLLSAPRNRPHPLSTSTPAAIAAPILVVVRVFMRGSLIAEGPGLPVVADPGPDAEESAGFEDEEDDDEQAVQHRLDLEDVGALVGLGAD